MSHTPAPWKAIHNDEEDWSVIKTEGKPSIGTLFICEHVSQGHDDGESDAKLIAAAPELLDALEKVQAYQIEAEIGSLANAQRMFFELKPIVESAIKKAKGL